MGTHPIFEYDFDCLTDGRISFHDKCEVDKIRSLKFASGPVEFGRGKIDM